MPRATHVQAIWPRKDRPPEKLRDARKVTNYEKVSRVETTHYARGDRTFCGKLIRGPYWRDRDAKHLPVCKDCMKSCDATIRRLFV